MDNAGRDRDCIFSTKLHTLCKNVKKLRSGAAVIGHVPGGLPAGAGRARPGCVRRAAVRGRSQEISAPSPRSAAGKFSYPRGMCPGSRRRVSPSAASAAARSAAPPRRSGAVTSVPCRTAPPGSVSCRPLTVQAAPMAAKPAAQANAATVNTAQANSATINTAQANAAPAANASELQGKA